MCAGRLSRRRVAITGHYRYGGKKHANHRNQCRHYFVHGVLSNTTPDAVVNEYIVFQRERMSAIVNG
jgi:hypothetical protein